MKSNIYSDFTRKVMAETLVGDDNAIVSPYSIFMLLAMAAFSTEGITRKEILNTISDGLTAEELVGLLEQVQEMCKDKKGVSSANAIAINNVISDSIVEEFKDLFSSQFDGEIFASAEIVNDINAWVKDKTNGMISDIANDSMKNMLLSLINAVSFEAEWRKKYEDDDIIEDSDFTNIDGSVSQVTMLDSVENMYIEDEFFEGFVKPYKTGYSFVGLLPKKKKSKFFLKRGLEQLDISALINNVTMIDVYAHLPEFKADFSAELKPVFEKWGIEDLFASTADFSPLSSANLKAEGIVHKAVIEVDRKGTKAAAVSMMWAVAGCAPERNYRVVHLDRTFVYAIVDNSSMEPIFTGVVNKL